MDYFDFLLAFWENYETKSLMQNLLKGIRGAEEKIGTQEISLDVRGKATEPPSIQNWLKDYDQHTLPPFELGKVIERGRLKEINYIENNKNARLLTRPEKDLLLQVLYLYDTIRFPGIYYKRPTEHSAAAQKRIASIIFPGVSEEKEAGEPSGAPVFRKALSPNELFKKYQQKLKDLSKIKDLEDKMIRASEANLREQLHQNLFQKDNVRSLAVLQVLAKRGQLPTLLKDDKRAIELLTRHFKGNKKDDLAKGLELNPLNPQYLSLFLQYIFKERLTLDEETAALYGMILADLSLKAGRKDLAKLVYYDAKSREFRWM